MSLEYYRQNHLQYCARTSRRPPVAGKEFLSALTAPMTHVQLLDAGCGAGSMLQYCRESGVRQIHGLDSCSELARAAADLSQSPVLTRDIRFFDDTKESWDGIYCSRLMDELTPVECQRVLTVFFKILKRKAPLWLDWRPSPGPSRQTQEDTTDGSAGGAVRILNFYPDPEVQSLLLQSGFESLIQARSPTADRSGILCRKI